jgi:hypothetical protein
MNYDDYFVVQARMVIELGLSGNRLLVYALIHGFCKDGNNEFTGSLNYLCDWTNLSRNTVISTLKSLVDDKLLNKREYIVNGVRYCAYSMGEHGKLPPLVHSVGGSAKISPNNIKDNIDERIEDTIISSKKEKRFIKPTIQEIQAHILEKGYTFDAEAFYAFYESNGWKVGKNPMKNWKMACTTWAKNRKSNYNNNANYGRETITDKIRRTVEESNQFSQQLADRIGKQADVCDGDDGEIW